MHHGPSGPADHVHRTDRALSRAARTLVPTLSIGRTVISHGADNEPVDELLAALDALGAALDRPAFAVRVHVSTHRPSLDRELALGDSPARCVALALRARQLVSRRNRERLARAL